MVLGKRPSNRQTRPRIQMFSQPAISEGQFFLAGAQQLQTILGFSQPAGDKNGIAGPSARAENGASTPALADNSNIDEDFLPPCGVPSGDGTFQCMRSFCQTV